MIAISNIFRCLKINKSRISGINLVGLMISSALGTFILAAIVKVSFTVSDNLQIIKATAELEASARILDNFFSKVFLANGYNNISTNLNRFRITPSTAPATGFNIKFPLWFAAGDSNAIQCSGQPVAIPTSPAPNNPVNVTIFLKQPTTPTAMDGYITCADNTLITPWATDNGSGNMPLVSKAQIADFYVVASVAATPPPPPAVSNMGNFIITTTNINPNNYNAVGIKLAILLKSTSPVFNADRVVTFRDIFGNKTFSNATTTNPLGDKFLYKLVIIQSPFPYALNFDAPTKINISS